MLNTFWNATKIDAMTAMLSQRVLDAISIDMVVRAPKRENSQGMLFSMLGVDSRTSPKARVGFGEKYTTSDWHRPGRTKLVHFASKRPKFDFSSESEDFELVFESVAFIR